MIALFRSNRNICINNGEATNKLHDNIVFQEIDIFRIWIFRPWVFRRWIAILVRNKRMAWAVERLQTGSTVAGLERRSGCGGGERGGSWRRGKLAGPGGAGRGVAGLMGGGGDGGHQGRARGISNVEYLNIVYQYHRVPKRCV